LSGEIERIENSHSRRIRFPIQHRRENTIFPSQSLKFDNNMLPSFGPDSINLKAQLKANSMTLDNPMATMMLLGLLNGEGEIVLPVQDFQTILSMIPPKMANMARMLAKKEGNNIVYKIKYQNGGLTVNGMPMM